ncbi:MAG: hypothetical protein KME26_21975, partial [Oscillatoria princeps RMCB-10]|nr:hypothetical protein [Oscillatoria princeps RMCB-10]
TDLVQSSVPHTLTAEVENLTLTGTAAINGTGNNLANTITGNTANNTLNGGAGDDTLSGLAGNDTLNGGDGNDSLNGGLGNDSLIGGWGNDTYVVDSAEDIVSELAAQGTDLVQSSVPHTLTAEVENLTLTGTAAINGTGNNLANTITGNTANNTLNGGAGNDTLNGGAGQDTLTGGAGADTFIFQFGQSSVSAPDRITDFAIGSDKIDLLTQSGAAMNAPSSFSRAANSSATTLQSVVNQVFTDANGSFFGRQALGINSAALVVATAGSIAGTYLVVNDANAGFQTSNDLVVNLTGSTGSFSSFLGNLTVSSCFV